MSAFTKWIVFFIKITDTLISWAEEIIVSRNVIGRVKIYSV